MNRVIISDALSGLQTLADKSVQLIVTSPPYWGLRSYLPKDHPLKALEIGCEPTPEEYVARLVAIFREARRVLRDDGSMWLNCGDSYAAGKCGRDDNSAEARAKFDQYGHGGGIKLQARGNTGVARRAPPGYKDKDLIGVPWMLAFALRADGWYLRARCPWMKRNGMPESTMDRPTTVIEDLFLLTKNDDYYYDPEAVRKIGAIRAGTRGAKGSTERAAVNGVNARPPEYKVYDGTRLRRSSDWFFETVRGLIGDDDGNPLAFAVNTKPYKGAHFATFNPELIMPCILSGTSDKGCCSKCGAPFIRIVAKTDIPDPSYKGSRFDAGKTGQRDGGDRTQSGERYLKQTTGWKPQCECEAGISPCVVLDPFAGSGTVGEVCGETGRDSILIELNPEYHPLIQQRAEKSPLPSRESGATVAK